MIDLVCTLYFDNNSNSNILYSGSFDSTAKVWNLDDLVKSDFKLKSTLTIKGTSLNKKFSLSIIAKKLFFIKVTSRLFGALSVSLNKEWF